jgi:nucleoside-diphosphate-sugar epimerase
MSGTSENKKRVLVTGSSGTIGTRLCERFLERGIDFVGVDKKKNQWNPEIDGKTVVGDLTDRKTLEKLPRDVGMVIHLAANARVYDLVVRPEGARENLDMLFNVLEFCRKNGVKKFVFASSREVYGNSEKTEYREEEVDVRRCESPYSASKLGGEAMVRSYRECYGIDFIIFRFSNVYGMYDSSDRVIPEFIRRTLKNQELVVFGKDKLLDFTYIDDCVEGMLRALDSFDGSRNRTYNLSSGRGITILETAEIIRDLMKASNGIKVEDSRPGEVTRFVGDITSARDSFGYSPQTSLEEGIRKSIDWYRDNVGS